eukprot:gene2214-2924_t
MRHVDKHLGADVPEHLYEQAKIGLVQPSVARKKAYEPDEPERPEMYTGLRARNFQYERTPTIDFKALPEPIGSKYLPKPKPPTIYYQWNDAGDGQDTTALVEVEETTPREILHEREILAAAEQGASSGSGVLTPLQPSAEVIGALSPTFDQSPPTPTVAPTSQLVAEEQILSVSIPSNLPNMSAQQ